MNDASRFGIHRIFMIILIVAFFSYEGLLPDAMLYYVLKREMLYYVSSSFLVFWGTLPCGVRYFT
jgi:hypothetical protein